MCALIDVEKTTYRRELCGHDGSWGRRHDDIFVGMPKTEQIRENMRDVLDNAKGRTKTGKYERCPRQLPDTEKMLASAELVDIVVNHSQTWTRELRHSIL